MIKDILSPDDLASVMQHPFVAAYWPLLLGGPFAFLFMIKGHNWSRSPWPL